MNPKTDPAGAQTSELQRKTDGYREPPTSTPPGDPIDPSSLKGRKVLNVWSSSAIPFCKLLGEEVVKTLGGHSIDLHTLQPRLSGLKSAVISVRSTHSNGQSQTTAENLSRRVTVTRRGDRIRRTLVQRETIVMLK